MRAATDTEIEVTKSDVSGVATAEVVKQRDKPSGDKFSFALEPIDIGQDDDGATITSCAVVDAEQPAKQSKTASLPKTAQIALRALAEAVDECGQPAPSLPQIPFGVKTVSQDQWRDQSYLRGISVSQGDSAKRMAFKRASEQLIGANRVGIWDTHVWIAA